MSSGTISKLTDRGFGFIASDEESSQDLFFHVKNLAENVVFDDLVEGGLVTFEKQKGKAGRGPIATQVRPFSSREVVDR